MTRQAHLSHLERLAIAKRVTEVAAETALAFYHDRGALRAETKAPLDYVSAADRKTEDVVRDLLAELCPDETLLGEEGGGASEGDHWILDPIDGTTNFLSGLPLWAVSLAYVQSGRPVVGVIALPVLGEIISAAQGQGLFGNWHRSVQERGISPPVGLFGVGRNTRWATEARILLEAHLVAHGQSVVCLGSCAISLAMAATHRLAGYVECKVLPWDIAAGELLCREAGLEVISVQSRGGVDIGVWRKDALPHLSALMT